MEISKQFWDHVLAFKRELEADEQEISWRKIQAKFGTSDNLSREILFALTNKAIINGQVSESEPLQQKELPKILLFDIETLPVIAYTWTLFKPYLSHDNIIKDWCMLSWASKWLFDPQIRHACLTPEEAVDRDDKRITRSLWHELDEADMVIAHNLKKFDQKRANLRFALNGYPPPSPYQLIDTLEISRKNFGSTSHRLDYLGKILVKDEKINTDFDLWIRCDNGDPDALDEMQGYNDQDVALLEEVYLELRPWVKSHPNCGLYMDSEGPVCPNCGNGNLTWDSCYYTPAGRYRAYRCDSCGAIGRSRFSDLSKKEKRHLTVGVAR